MLQLGQPVARGRIVLTLQRLALDTKLHQPPVELVKRLGLAVHLHAQPARRLVDQVDRLVRQKAIGDVAVRQRRRGDQRAVGDAHAVMQLVFLLDAAQDRDRVGNRGLADEHRLETAGQRRVLLHMQAILVERRGADAVQRAAGELGLDQVGGVHRAVRLAGADQRVHLVDEQDDLALGGLDLLQHRLQPLLELAAIFCSRNHRAEVERQHLLVLERLRHVAIDDAQRQTLDDRRLADARLADQHRIVLGAPRQHLDGPANFLVAPDHRIELAGAGDRGDVAGIFLQRVETLLGVGAVDPAAAADLGHCLLQRLGRDARRGERRCRRAARGGQRQQQAVLRNVAVAGLGRGLLRRVQQADELGRRLRLAGAAAAHLRQAGELGLHGVLRRKRIAASGADQARRRTLLVVQQRLEQVLGRQPLMKLADRDGLRGLQKAFAAIGKLLDVHMSLSLSLGDRAAGVPPRGNAPARGRHLVNPSRSLKKAGFAA